MTTKAHHSKRLNLGTIAQTKLNATNLAGLNFAVGVIGSLLLAWLLKFPNWHARPEPPIVGTAFSVYLAGLAVFVAGGLKAVFDDIDHWGIILLVIFFSWIFWTYAAGFLWVNTYGT